MSKLLAHRSLIAENFILLIGVCLCFYFSYHALQGNRSYLRLAGLESSISSLSQEYKSLKSERVTLETKVRAMRPGSLSRDLLEERARVELGYRGKDEVEIKSN